ncbi:UrcA family protein [Novosphingobium hassiacum]|uniref:UrcA family protein n=1 Tax=Novosphingobium hassiacum TaxID=173676 RepID=A0A7W5ZUS4_9SPHN|nr:UrcA family protein [Novosphingobium hassiacum]MBB3860361.1 UrcA family protein [Novosphingobium hassiacum]
MKRHFIALAAIGLLSAPQTAFAGEAAQTVHISVSSEGLDLSNSSDLRRLRVRISEAAAEACDPSDRWIDKTLPNYQCRRAAIASVEPIVQQMASAARHGQAARSR